MLLPLSIDRTSILATTILLGVQAYIFFRQLKAFEQQVTWTEATVIAMNKSNEENQISSRLVQRACVTFYKLEVLEVASKTYLLPIWQNSGCTAGIYGSQSAGCELIDSKIYLAQDKVFPTTSTIPIDFGPGISFGERIDITEYLPFVQDGSKRLYFYGWALYNNVFDPDGIRRKTEACYEVLFDFSAKQIGGDHRLGVHLSAFKNHNRVDKDNGPRILTNGFTVEQNRIASENAPAGDCTWLQPSQG